MNKRQSFKKYINYAKNQLHLKDWSVIISNNNADDGNLAECRLCYGRKIITIYLSDAFLLETKEIQRHTIIHELIHAHFGPAHDLACDRLDPNIKTVFVRLVEYGVDGIADAIAKFFKLP